MKKGILSLILCLILVLLVPMCAFANEYGDEIEYYNVDIVVNENNSYDITENIGMNFASSAHGLERRIPYELTVYRDINGEVLAKDYIVDVSDFSASEGYTTDKSGGFYTVRIGDEDTYVEGLQDYKLSYHYDVGDDGIEDFDDFYYNIIDTVWDMPINNVTFSITMPKDFDASKIAFQLGETGSGYNEGVEYKVNGNVVTGSVTREVGNGEGVSVRIELPQGYYVGARMPVDYSGIAFIAAIACLGVAALFVVLFARPQKPVIPVEFYAPEGMTSADVGFVVDGSADDKDIISLIIYWADKGYLDIKDGKGSAITLIKKKDMGEEHDAYEKVVFRGLFMSGNKVLLSSLKYNFYDKVNSSKELLKNKYSTAEKMLFTGKSKSVSAWATFVMIAIFVVSIVMMGLIEHMEFGDAIMPVIFGIIGLSWYTAVASRNYDARKSEKRSVKMKMIVLQVILAIAVFGIYGFAMVDSCGVWSLMFVGATLLLALAIPTFKQRTKYGLEMLGRILGFKKFINSVEKEKLVMLVEEDPAYFYNVLPYAYVLGVTDKWAKKFEGIEIEPPTWYIGSEWAMFNSVYFTTRLMRSMNTTQDYMTAVQNKSSGSFSGGGGFGGGFSGGGFGGGGGGRW